MSNLNSKGLMNPYERQKEEMVNVIEGIVNNSFYNIMREWFNDRYNIEKYKKRGKEEKPILYSDEDGVYRFHYENKVKEYYTTPYNPLPSKENSLHSSHRGSYHCDMNVNFENYRNEIIPMMLEFYEVRDDLYGYLKSHEVGKEYKMIDFNFTGSIDIEIGFKFNPVYFVEGFLTLKKKSYEENVLEFSSKLVKSLMKNITFSMTLTESLGLSFCKIHGNILETSKGNNMMAYNWFSNINMLMHIINRLDSVNDLYPKRNSLLDIENVIGRTYQLETELAMALLSMKDLSCD